MRILMLAQFYPPIAGGEERHVQALAAALVARGHEVDVMTTATPGEAAGTREQDAGGTPVRVHRVRTTAQRVPRLHSDPARPHAPPLPDPAMARAVGAMLAERRPDVLHAHDWVVMSALPAARRLRVPVVVTLHDYGEVCATKRLVRSGAACRGPSPSRCVPCTLDHFGPAGPAIAAANLVAAAWRRRAVAEFLPVSSAVAAASQLAAHGVPFTVVPNFIPDALVVPSLATAGGPTSAPLLYAGDVSVDKGVDVLLAAYAGLPAGGVPELLLAGRRVAGAGLAAPAGARFLGELPHAEVTALMATARLVAVPSIYPDPCPTVVLEAMAAGRPVVASATGGIPDLVADGSTGRLVPPGEAGPLAAAIAELLADPARAAALGRAGRERVRAFTASAVVAAVEAAYRRAAGRLAAAPGTVR